MTEPQAALSIGGLRYMTPSERDVRVRLGQFVGVLLQHALPRIHIPGCSPEWWAAELQAGGVRIERRHLQNLELEPVSADYIVGDDDVAHVRVHVHEWVVPDHVPDVVYEDNDVLAVSKRAGVEIFMNPLGGAIRSSLIGMLEDLGYRDVIPVHRVDKLVSGVVCLAKNKKSSSRLARCIHCRNTRKTYLARVHAPTGPPKEGLEVDASLNIDPARGTAYVDPAGKPSATVVRRLVATFGDGTALIAVEPLTGRMHQIRCHLAHAGFPIANDVKYGGVVKERGPSIYQDNTAGELRGMLQSHFREGCETCTYFLRVVDGDEPAPRLSEGIWLHSWRYEFPTLGLTLEAPLPLWACSEDCKSVVVQGCS